MIFLRLLCCFVFALAAVAANAKQVRRASPALPTVGSDFGTGVGQPAPIKRGVTYGTDLSPLDGAQTLINNTIIANGRGLITGPVLNAALNALIPVFNSMGQWDTTQGNFTIRNVAGLVGNGTATGDGIAIQAVMTASAASGGQVLLPCGKFNASGGLAATIAAGKSLTVRGIAPDCTTIYFPAGEGINLTYGSPFSSVHFRDLTITTGAVGTGNPAVSLTYGLYYGNPANTAQNDFANVVIRGDDGYNATDYWSYCYRVTNVSNVNWTGGMCAGSSSSQGIGALVQGNGSLGSGSYGVAYNFTGTTFNNNSVGIEYGSFVQGVTLNQVNITGASTGVQLLSSAMGTAHGLAIIGSQIGLSGSNGVGVDMQQEIGGLSISSGTLFVLNGSGTGNTFVKLNGVAGAAIVGAQFNGSSSTTNTAISMAGGGFNTVAANTFGNFNVGVSVASGSGYNTIDDNTYNSLTTTVSDSGTGTNVSGTYLSPTIHLGSNIASTPPFATLSGTSTYIYDGSSDQAAVLTPSASYLRGPNVYLQNFGGTQTYGIFGSNGAGLGGHIYGTGAMPTVTTTSGAVSLSSTANDNHGTVTASAAGTVTLTFAAAAPTVARDCVFSKTNVGVTTNSTTGFTVVVSNATSFSYICMGP